MCHRKGAAGLLIGLICGAAIAAGMSEQEWLLVRWVAGRAQHVVDSTHQRQREHVSRTLELPIAGVDDEAAGHAFLEHVVSVELRHYLFREPVRDIWERVPLASHMSLQRLEERRGRTTNTMKQLQDTQISKAPYS